MASTTTAPTTRTTTTPTMTMTRSAQSGTTATGQDKNAAVSSKQVIESVALCASRDERVPKDDGNSMEAEAKMPPIRKRKRATGGNAKRKNNKVASTIRSRDAAGTSNGASPKAAASEATSSSACVAGGAPAKTKRQQLSELVDNHELVRALKLLDPILQFLTRATGQTMVQRKILQATIPKSMPQAQLVEHLRRLHKYGILHYDEGSQEHPDEAIGGKSRGAGRSDAGKSKDDEADNLGGEGNIITNTTTNARDNANDVAASSATNNSSNNADDTPKQQERVGFPSPYVATGAVPVAGMAPTNLHASTKTAAKRRMAALRKLLTQELKPKKITKQSSRKCSTYDHLNSQHPHQQDEADGNDGTAQGHGNGVDEHDQSSQNRSQSNEASKDWRGPPASSHANDIEEEEDEIIHHEAANARKALVTCFQFQTTQAAQRNNASKHRMLQDEVEGSKIPTYVLPKQLAYAGSHPAQSSVFCSLSPTSLDQLPSEVMDAFHLKYPDAPETCSNEPPQRELYSHQVEAIDSALSRTHTLVCTGTGSGKSLCFLLPALSAAYNDNATSLIMFPTKALAQDQLSKLTTLLETSPDLAQRIRPATLDGDTPHMQRTGIVESANIILTNPDTMHAAILPQWKHLYQPMLAALKYLVIDEAHLYEGVFGAHVAMVLSRLARVSALAAGNADRPPLPPTIVACSATLPHPEHHLRLLCPIAKSDPVNIVQQDGSPRSTKHFFIWNPPILNAHGRSIGQVTFPKRRGKKGQPMTVMDAVKTGNTVPCPNSTFGFTQSGTDGVEMVGASVVAPTTLAGNRISTSTSTNRKRNITTAATDSDTSQSVTHFHRRHSADETAFLLARAVAQGVRCIAFCKTRCLVEWVYERAVSALKQNKSTADLASKVESYRGGYSRDERRKIEARLFQNQVLGVVATSALELGVDIGGLDLTLHCGFPSSYASLLQQAGRAGRGGARMEVPSLAVVVCFNSPPDQHLWRHPTTLLTKGLSTPICMPIYPGLVQGHLLCAGSEFPLTLSRLTVANIQETGAINGDTVPSDGPRLLSDQELFGSAEVYMDAMETLHAAGDLKQETISIDNNGRPLQTKVYKTHGSIDRPSQKVSLRSIEPVSYAIVDLSHPMQGNQMDGVRNEKAVMDHMPYSRIFYHAFPGAMIMHRGRRYKIVSVTRPPAFAKDTGASYRSMTLAAYAKPSNQRYMTRPLSNLSITVTKQMERVDIRKVGNEVESSTTTADDHAKAQSLAQSVPQDPTMPLPDVTQLYATDADDPSLGSFAGCGIVNVKRNVHGYTKLSMVTRKEIGRSELSLPDMEYDSFAIWLDCEAEAMGLLLGNDYAHGVHALSHAIMAVAPLFVPCVASDVECDHSVYRPTRVTIFDSRAGGSGICAQLWKAVFLPNGIVEAAVDLMDSCSSCQEDSGYEGGCPACIQSGSCIKFNDYLSKSAAITIGRRILHRIQQTHLYKANVAKQKSESDAAESSFVCIDCDQGGENDGVNNEAAMATEQDTSTRTSPSAGAGTATPSTPRTPKRNPRMSKYSPPQSSSPPDVMNAAGEASTARDRAMRNAKDILSARDRQIVVGRPGWMNDEAGGFRRQDA